MLSLGKLWPVAMVATFCGCLTELTVSSSGAGGSGGNGGGGSCDEVICDKRPAGCPMTDCSQLAWAHRAGSFEEEQQALSVAMDQNGHVAIAGTYRNGGFFFDGSQQVGVPDAGPSEGFVAYYDPAGAPLWAMPFGAPNVQAYREARSVAFDADGFVIVAGIERFDAQDNHLFLERIHPGGSGGPMIQWVKASLSGESTRTEAVAVATDQTDIYVLGRAKTFPTPVNCGGVNTQIQAGMFVAKYAADMSCIWYRSINSATIDGSQPVAIVARNAAKNGVWITGMFSNPLDVTPLNALLPTSGLYTFLIKLDATDGTPTGAYQFERFMGSIIPAALDVTAAGGPILVGTVQGMTEFSSNLEAAREGAFVATIDPVDPYTATVHSLVLPGSASPAQGARATGIHIWNDKLHVSGTFSTDITLPASGELLANTSNVPFLAVFDEKGPTLLSFDAFEVPEAAESYASKFVQLAGSSHGLALAGGWIRSLDLSTPDKQVNGLLPSSPAATNSDIFVAKFNPL